MPKVKLRKRKEVEEEEAELEEVRHKAKKEKKHKRNDADEENVPMAALPLWVPAMQVAAQQAMVMQGLWPMQMTRPMMPQPFLQAPAQYGWFPVGPQVAVPRGPQPRAQWPMPTGRSSGPARATGMQSRAVPPPSPAESVPEADPNAAADSDGSASSDSSGTSSSSSSASQAVQAEPEAEAQAVSDPYQLNIPPLDAPKTKAATSSTDAPAAAASSTVANKAVALQAHAAQAAPAATTPGVEANAATPAEDEADEAEGIPSLLGGSLANAAKAQRNQKKSISFKLQGAKEAMAAAQKVTDLEAELKAVRARKQNVRDATTQTVRNPLQDGEKVTVWRLRPRGMESFPHFPK
mmetsp:Transcript_70503/g.131870  ORF Transcript_70503/g.131870 Transcript_70503/m.131870 type:complete len:351 (-) Transcript_70503:28-1080(-)